MVFAADAPFLVPHGSKVIQQTVIPRVDASNMASQEKVLIVEDEPHALSGLADRPVRWITDDVLTFMGREVKRGRRYDAFILDPPAFGRLKGGGT